ncbi:sensor histidine kinase, partial [Bifidobacterium angulatum]
AANLVANAAEHARSRVAVSCDVEGGHLVIEVADDGPGFSPAALERGCERLFTDDSSRSSRDGGRHYGLGLHAASEAASAHGGSVSLANSPSGGAVVTIAVPL